MAKSKNKFPSLVSQLSRAKATGGKTASSPDSVSAIAASESSVSSKLTGFGRSQVLRVSSFSAKKTANAIKFGNPGSSITSSSSGSAWSSLLKQTASGGISSALSGSLGSIAGLGSIISGIVGLFGGSKSTPPPLVPYQMPASEDQSISIGSGGSISQSSKSSGPANAPIGASQMQGNYESSQASAQPFQYQSAQIAQAVKQALLNSSSLNDVIAEI